jgi:citrate lyase subunit beta/citryl-CoA lyase/(S)-citramalyl-CoA lyase
MAYRSLLFVPGARPDRFEKAIASGADAVCIDLEDAVAPAQKAEARIATLNFLSKPLNGAVVGLRVNALSTVDGPEDAAALAKSAARPAFVMIPKAASGLEVEQVRAALGVRCPPLWPLMETAEAFFALPDIARAVGEAGGIMFGGADYSASIGSDMGWDALYAARAAIVAAAALSGCETIDVPFLDVKDEAGLMAETRRVKAMGFTGRACIHPAQVAAINAIFTPSTDEISKAEKIRAAYEAAGGGVALVDGKLIERPVLRAAERVLAAKGK